MLHQRLGHRSTRSLLAGDNDNIWEDIEIRIDTYPFCTSCQISSMNKKARSKNPLKPKAPFKWFLMYTIPSTAIKSLTSDTTFYNYLLIVHAYSKIEKLYSMEKITIEEVMDKLDMFQSRSGKTDEFGYWDLERISADVGTKFTLTEFKEEFQTCRVHLTLAAQEYQKMNEQVKVTLRTLHTIAHYLMIHARVLEACINFASLYMTDQRRRSANHTIYTFNRYKTFSIIFTCVIVSMCCMESYCTVTKRR